MKNKIFVFKIKIKEILKFRDWCSSEMPEYSVAFSSAALHDIKRLVK